VRLDCSAALLQSECTFNGAWGGSKLPAVFYISSYFWDRAQDVGLIPNDKVRHLLWIYSIRCDCYKAALWPVHRFKPDRSSTAVGDGAGNFGRHQTGSFPGKG
jgi:hypothetical protein